DREVRYADGRDTSRTVRCVDGASIRLGSAKSRKRPESSAPDERPALNGRTMKKQNRRRRSEEKDTLRPEYDFSKGVRGKHATKYAAGTNVVVLQPDVARDFRTAKEVNETLRP